MMLKQTKIASPAELKRELSISPMALENIESSRREIRSILDNKDPRLLIIMGLALSMILMLVLNMQIV